MDMQKVHIIKNNDLMGGIILLVIGLLIMFVSSIQIGMARGRRLQQEVDASMFQLYENESALLKTENIILDSMYVESQQALRGIMLTKMEEKNAVKHGEETKKIESEVRPRKGN